MVLKAQSTSIRNKSTSDIEFLDICDVDDEGFIEGDMDAGKVLSTFNFGMIPASNNDKVSPMQNQTYSSAPRGLTTPINVEHYTVKRSYAMRPSTVRKLNALKAEHPDVNLLFNTLVDMANSHYYNYIFNEKGTFHNQEEKKKTS